MARTPESLVGKPPFGYLTVIAPAGHTSHPTHRRALWLCRCVCGKEIIVKGGSLRSGHTKSCGCFADLQREIGPRKHGATVGRKRSLEYCAWLNMRDRCLNSSHPSYANYGGRGVVVCERWRDSFVSFQEDILASIGPRPSKKHSLERENNEGHYEPGNVRWATQTEQLRNTRRNHVVTFRNETQPIVVWCERFNLAYQTVLYRLRTGWSVADALSTPTRSPFAGTNPRRVSHQG